MKHTIKTLLAVTPSIGKIASIFVGKFPKIFVYHRFCQVSCGNQGVIDAETFDWQIRQIKRDHDIFTLAEYLRAWAKSGRHLNGAAIITVDDGYRDFFDIAFPILKRHTAKATFFVTVGFINGNTLLWPDVIDFITRKCEIGVMEIRHGGKKLLIELTTEDARRKTWSRLVDYCISLPDDGKWQFLKKLEESTTTWIPDVIPGRYQPATWEQVEEMQKYGIEIGSHTMTHPILSRIPAESYEEEIVGSKKALERRLGREVETFCYPNGTPGDINDDIVARVSAAGYSGAVFGVMPFFDNPYLLPRVGVSNDKIDFLWKVAGMELMTDRNKFGKYKKLALRT